MTFASSHQSSADWQALQRGLHRFVQTRAPMNEVEDIVSDILEAIIRNQSTLGTASNPSAWIYAVARSKIVDFYRRQSRARDTTNDLQNDPTFHEFSEMTSNDEQSEAAGLSACLSDIISGMEENDQNILTEIDLKRTRQTEFAARHNIGLPSVKSRIQRARKRLRNRLIACCPDGTSDGCGDTCQSTASCTTN
ncbi:MAG: sigma-70 family RNA polymerase sigma factor [Thalassospira sp.]|uniref:sigma-70 family RNA polymerase sigma factor n=1 Tax=Thalassospira sp. TaxID=1912094 RepID=UPI0032EE94D8